jgi:serine/threonine protein kinase
MKQPENLLCSSSNLDALLDLKIADFGVAKQLQPNEKIRGVYGSPSYMGVFLFL